MTNPILIPIRMSAMQLLHYQINRQLYELVESVSLLDQLTKQNAATREVHDQQQQRYTKHV